MAWHHGMVKVLKSSIYIAIAALALVAFPSLIKDQTRTVKTGCLPQRPKV